MENKINDKSQIIKYLKTIWNYLSAKFVQNVSRILCPAFVGRDTISGLSTVYIDIYTSSQANISYSLHVAYFETFVIRFVHFLFFL
jgi:hypothetical protein